MDIDRLENQVGILQILLYVFRKKKTFLSEIIYEAKINQQATYNALKKLNDLKLIREEPEAAGFGRPKRWLYLTERGKKVAEELVKIEKILKEK